MRSDSWSAPFAKPRFRLQTSIAQHLLDPLTWQSKPLCLGRKRMSKSFSSVHVTTTEAPLFCSNSTLLPSPTTTTHTHGVQDHATNCFPECYSCPVIALTSAYSNSTAIYFTSALSTADIFFASKSGTRIYLLLGS